MDSQIQECFDYAFRAVTTAAFGTNMPGGIAKALLVTANTTALTLTKPDGTTINVGDQPLGTIVRIPCTVASFGVANSIIALA
jgi:hypothetical protein